MNMLSDKFETVEEGIQKLKEGVALRNQMGGALYWNILNDDCEKIARKLWMMGADYGEICNIMNS